MNFQERLSERLGFSHHYLMEMKNASERGWLMTSNTLVWVGLTLMSISAGLFVWMLSSGSYWLRLVIACSIAVAAYLFLMHAHALSVTAGGSPLNQPSPDQTAWTPNRVRIILFLALATLLSQPILLWMQNDKLTSQAFERTRSRLSNQFDVRQQNYLAELQETLQQKRSVLADEQVRIAPELFKLTERGISLQEFSTRKALLIGVSKYDHNVKQLPNVVNDIAEMERKLRQMGYAVSVSMDETKEAIQRKLEDYSSTLRSGDISLLYLAGHGMEYAGHNYFIPRDFADRNYSEITRQLLKSRALSITPYIDNLTAQKLRLHLVIVDACRTALDKTPRGLAAMQSTTSRNTLIAMSASPGQEALDGLPDQKGGNSPYAAALLRHLDADEDIGRVFRRVTKDVVDATKPTSSKNGEKPQTPWLSESITDSEIKLVAPTTEKAESVFSRNNAQQVAPACFKAYEEKNDTAALVHCVNEEVASLTRRIGYLETRIQSTKGLATVSSDALTEKAIFFAERLKLLWTTYVMTAPLTLLVAALMVGGIWLRDMHRPQALRAYESVRHQLLRDELRGFHEMNQTRIEETRPADSHAERMMRFKHWSYQKGFFVDPHESDDFKKLSNHADTRGNDRARDALFGWLKTLSFSR